jgi:hypothetical protein
MFARVDAIIDNYLREAHKYDVRIFGSQVNLLHMSEGIRRAERYKDALAELGGAENLLIKKLFKDLEKGNQGVFETSTRFRKAILFVLLQLLGMTEKEVKEKYESIESHETIYAPILAPANFLSNGGMGMYINTTTDNVIMNMMTPHLRKLMQQKGYLSNHEVEDHNINRISGRNSI